MDPRVPPKDAVEDDDSSFWPKEPLEVLEGALDVIEMMKGSAATDQIELFIQNERGAVAAQILDVRSRALSTCDSEHLVRNVHSDNALIVLCQIDGEDAGTASDIKGSTASLAHVGKEELIAPPMQGRNEVKAFSDPIKGAGHVNNPAAQA